MRRPLHVALLLAAAGAFAFAHHGAGECATTRETSVETMFRHRQMLRMRTAQARRTPVVHRDIGDIAVIDDAGGVVERQNQFNLDAHTLTFTPATVNASQYRYSVGASAPAPTQLGTALAGLGDDDSRLVDLPFSFPFFGVNYSRVYVNSDGNLTFGAGDDVSTQRSLGRMTAGPPRISPLFDDLNPGQAGSVRVVSQPAFFAVIWSAVPEYSDSGTGALQNFQVTLRLDGSIHFAYFGVNPSSAVVGISPGALAPGTTLVDFRSDAPGVYASTVAEVFGNQVTIDIVTAAQRFYSTHEDSYDYLIIYNAMGIPALGEGTVAYEQTVRSSGHGYGVPPLDDGTEFGSATRLRSVINMGPLNQYPIDPKALVPARAPQHDTPLTILGHEAGHLFLAYASIPGATGASNPPMLGYQLAHWSFLYDSEASLLEGERIADRGATVPPEFLTTDITRAYSPLDQYLMGFRMPAQVPDTFVVTNPTPNYTPFQHQFPGIGFDGTRQNISVNNVIVAEGPRIPDATVAQRHFRFGFILLVASGTQPSAADLAQVGAYRRDFEQFYAEAANGNAAADTTLKHSVHFSLFPAAGIAIGTSGSAIMAIDQPRRVPLTVNFQSQGGFVRLPASVTIPAGATEASFRLTASAPGVEEITAVPSDASYETTYVRVQAADATTAQLKQVGADPLAIQLTDANGLPYPGAGLVAIPSADGAVTPSEAFTDARGIVIFQWRAGTPGPNSLRISVDGAPGIGLTLTEINSNGVVH